jgi:ATP-dependent DNA helicase RecQ
MRLYGGELYTDFTTISESQIAQLLKTSPQEVQIELEQLHKLQLMVYEPQNEKPKITFILPRQDAERLPVDKKEFDRRRDLHFTKMDAMVSFVEQGHRCRMQVIQEYFDEITYNACGICDVCIQKRKNEDRVVFNDYEEQIMYLLNQKPLTLEELEVEVAPRERELFVDAVRDMVDAGQIYYDEVWVLHLLAKNK